MKKLPSLLCPSSYKKVYQSVSPLHAHRASLSVSFSNMNRQLRITMFLERKTSATVQASAQDRLHL